MCCFLLQLAPVSRDTNSFCTLYPLLIQLIGASQQIKNTAAHVQS